MSSYANPFVLRVLGLSLLYWLYAQCIIMQDRGYRPLLLLEEALLKYKGHSSWILLAFKCCMLQVVLYLDVFFGTVSMDKFLLLESNHLIYSPNKRKRF